MTQGPVQDFRMAVMVISCDASADLWPPFFTLFKRFWPDCPHPVFLVTNALHPVIDGIHVLAIGKDRSWSANTKAALEAIPCDYVLMFLEDLLLCGPVKQDRIDRVLDWVLSERPDYVLFNPTERASQDYNGLVSRVPPGSLYRTSTVVSLWKKQTLSALLKEEENAWEFELLGSERSDVYSEFFATRESCFPIVNGVVKGKWQRGAVASLRRLGLEPDLLARQLMTRPQYFNYRLRVVRSAVFRSFPWWSRRLIRGWLKGK